LFTSSKIMEVIEEVVDGGALLEQVQPENREIFQNEDSDEEFLGFDTDDLENDDEIAPFEDTWVPGNLDARDMPFDGESKINADLGDDPAMIYFFRLYIQNVNEEFIDLLVEETDRYVTAFFRSVQQLKPQSRFKMWSDVDTNHSMFIKNLLSYICY